MVLTQDRCVLQRFEDFRGVVFDNRRGGAIPLLSRGGVDATSIKRREATLMERTGWFVQLPIIC